VSNWLNLSWHSRNPADEWARQQQQQGPVGGPAANPGPNPGAAGGYQAPNPAPGTTYQNVPYQNVPYANVPYQNVPPPAPGSVPPIPPVPPAPYWRRREPIGAVILIGLGLIFLLNQLGYVTARIVHYSWPLVLIALGAWLIIRRVGDTKGGQQ
ncbi:MAG TPA: DUF5668 domain-containing protein, partial [Terracidiphilus sp.]